MATRLWNRAPLALLASAAIGCSALEDAPSGTATQDAPLASAVPTLFGAAFAPTDDVRFDDLVGQWGGMKIRRSYDNATGVDRFLDVLQDQDIRHGSASAYSFKYQPAEVLAGTHDEALHRFFQGIADGHKVYWTYWHEPDDELYKDHTMTPADYRAAWAHIRSIADAEKAARPALDIAATFILMEYSMTPSIAPERPLLGPDGMYPGDEVIDVFGVDAYNNQYARGGVTNAATQFRKVIDFAEAHGKPWAIGEIGSCPVEGNAAGRAKYLKNAINYWNSRRAPVFVAYFNLDKECDYRLDGDEAATAIWRKGVTGSAR